MTKEEAKKMGATHYNHRTETFYKFYNDVLYYWEGEWRLSYYKKPYLMIYIKPL